MIDVSKGGSLDMVTPTAWKYTKSTTHRLVRWYIVHLLNLMTVNNHRAPYIWMEEHLYKNYNLMLLNEIQQLRMLRESKQVQGHMERDSCLGSSQYMLGWTHHLATSIVIYYNNNINTRLVKERENSVSTRNLWRYKCDRELLCIYCRFRCFCITFLHYRWYCSILFPYLHWDRFYKVRTKTNGWRQYKLRLMHYTRITHGQLSKSHLTQMW